MHLPYILCVTLTIAIVSAKPTEVNEEEGEAIHTTDLKPENALCEYENEPPTLPSPLIGVQIVSTQQISSNSFWQLMKDVKDLLGRVAGDGDYEADYTDSAEGKTIDEIIMEAGSGTETEDGDQIIEGDVVMTEKEIYEYYGASDFRSDNETEIDDEMPITALYRALPPSSISLWRDGIVPFKFSANFTTERMEQVKAAMAELETYTCINFRPATEDDVNTVLIGDFGGCWTYVGNMSLGEQRLSIGAGCATKYGVMHDLLHLLGFVHEGSRSDRDDYVAINFINIKSQYMHNFLKMNESWNEVGSPFDFDSLLHLNVTNFSTSFRPTFAARPFLPPNRVGQRMGLSFNDIMKINVVYQCAKCPMTKWADCPAEGLLLRDCSCVCDSGNLTNSVVSCSISSLYAVQKLEAPYCSVTLHGEQCLSWSNYGYSVGHFHGATRSMFDVDGFCRNPNDAPVSWCFVANDGPGYRTAPCAEHCPW